MAVKTNSYSNYKKALENTTRACKKEIKIFFCKPRNSMDYADYIHEHTWVNNPTNPGGLNNYS